MTNGKNKIRKSTRHYNQYKAYHNARYSANRQLVRYPEKDTIEVVVEKNERNFIGKFVHSLSKIIPVVSNLIFSFFGMNCFEMLSLRSVMITIFITLFFFSVMHYYLE